MWGLTSPQAAEPGQRRSGLWQQEEVTCPSSSGKRWGVGSSFFPKVTAEFISVSPSQNQKLFSSGTFYFFHYSPQTAGELCLLGLEAASQS